MNTGALEQVTQFFNTKAQMTDVSNAMDITSFLIEVAIVAVEVLGFVALAIWVVRIGMDLLAITLRGTSMADTFQKLGTAKDNNAYDSAGAYIKSNLFQIVLVVVLVVLMITGWIFKLFAMSITGIGTILNRLLGIDIGSLMSTDDVDGWIDNIKLERDSAVLNEYDTAVNQAANYAQTLYDMGTTKHNTPEWTAVSTQYTNAILKAEYISTKKAKPDKLASKLNKEQNYFNQHRTNDSICNINFLDDGVEASWQSKVALTSCS